MINLFKNIFGVTVIELTIVIALLSVLAAYTAPDYARIINEAKEVTCKLQRKALEEAQMLYLTEHDFRQSAGTEKLLQEGYIDVIPQCQEGGRYYWKKISPRPELGCTIHSVRERN